jgi:hypothetical protein
MKSTQDFSDSGVILFHAAQVKILIHGAILTIALCNNDKHQINSLEIKSNQIQKTLS